MGDIEILAEAPPPAAADDIGEGAQCADHPYRGNPGGICAFCLQEKLGKLVSSSSAASSSSPFLFLRPQPSSSSSPSFRSTTSSSAAAAAGPAVQTIAPKKKSVGSSSGTKKTAALIPSNNVSMLKRSKSVAPASVDSPRKKSFWSFLYLSSSSSSSSNKRRSTSSAAGESAGDRDLKQSEEKRDAKTLESEAESPGSGSHVSSSSFSRKVARSRSVGCGSRSFSGDFLERISTGFGDCTLRRVESHREPNSKTAVHHRQQLDHDSEQRIKERVKCGGIFGGFGMISSSSSAYWLSAAACAAAAGDDGDDFDTRRSSTARASTSMVLDSRSRNRSWAWAFASPMRAFKPATTSKSYEPRNAVSSVNGGGNGAGNGKAVNGGGGGNTRKVGANPSLLAAH